MNLHSLILLSADVTVDKPTGVLGSLATAAEDFIKVFNKGGSVLLSLMGGILPTLIVLLTAVNALVRLIGAEKIENLGKAAARPGIQWYPVRYIILPFVAVFVLTNPMAYTMGRFLPERFKPAFYDS
ncbi:MAG: PTS glucitol/sorbitol transporter subunit IIC, partial [Actinomycetes bacterium]